MRIARVPSSREFDGKHTHLLLKIGRAADVAGFGR